MRRGDKPAGAVDMTGRHVHLNPLGGMAGDMFVAAMLDALPDLREGVMRDVAAVLPEGGGIALKACTVSGLTATRLELLSPKDEAPADYPAMDRRIAEALIEADVRQCARALLRSLAEAEAEVHGVALHEVHFHEIADWDTLADLTAAGHILTRLEGAIWSLDPLPLGEGLIATAHGTLPVPAPATAVLLRGLPVRRDGIPGERVTPTGAAIARHLFSGASGHETRAAGLMGATGYGAGTRKLDGIANLLVATVIEPRDAERFLPERVCVIEFDIDDMTGEEIAVAAGRLRGVEGVLDLTTMTGIGKKGRGATLFRLLLAPQHEAAVASACFTQTSTLGLRLREEARLCLDRKQEVREVDGRSVRVKHATRPGGVGTCKPESDDIAQGESLAERRALAARAST